MINNTVKNKKMVSEVLSSPATDGGPGIVNILMDLGPACTSNAGTFRDALRLITQKLPSNNTSANNNNNNNNISSGAIPLKEGGIARLIHFFAAVGARKDVNNSKASSNSNSNKDASLSSAFVGALINDSTTDWNKADLTSPSDWNIDVVSQVLTDFSLSLHWPLVARSFDFAEFKIRDVRHLEVLLALYSRASSGGKFGLPLESIVGEWRNTEGQLTLLRGLLIVPPAVYVFVLEEGEERKDAAAAVENEERGSGNNSTSTPVVVGPTCPNPGGFASAKVLQRLLSLSDEPKLHQSAREVLGMGLQSCPEIILCALVRLQLSNAAAINVADNNNPQLMATIRARANAGMPLKGELMRELIPLFFSPNPKWIVKNPTGAIRRLWEISPNTVVAACVEAFKVLPNVEERAEVVAYQCNLLRKSLPNAENGALQQVVSGSKDADFAYTLACFMSDNGLLDFSNWLSERMNGVGKAAVALQTIVFLTRTYNKAKLRSVASSSNNMSGGSGGDSSIKLVLSWENLASMLRMLTMLDNDTMGQVIPNTDTTLGSQSKIILERCLQMYPNIAALTNSTTTSSSNNNSNSGGGAASTTTASGNQTDEIEEAANSYFQKIYASEESAREVVEMLKRFKTSGSSRENDIFACMIHNLFDEYRFFSKYPEKELRITGILFGLLIKEQLVSSITLGIALRYVLEALRKPPNQSPQSGKMFRFGMFALEQFKERLHEWPQYCSHIVQIGHLREGYAALVGEIETAMDDNQSAGSVSTAPTVPTGASVITESSVGSVLGGEISVPSSSMGGFVGSTTGSSTASLGGLAKIDLGPPKPKKAVFGPGLGRAVNSPVEQNETQNEAPPDQILDRVQFLINNLSISNCVDKANDLRDILERRYFPWLGNYLVVKRISTQPNFHTMYLCFIDSLGEYGKGLVDAIISSVYVNVGKLLRSQKITTSTSERSLLKNLGSWLGQITLARNRPILQIMLDCKELLFQGYETGMLIAVTPFVAKILEGAKNSTVFRPPNPWVMGLMGVFRALYNVDDLKMNIKFEVEVLCKNLNLKLEDIPLRNADLSKRVPPVKEKNPDFNLKSQSAPAPAAASPDKHSSGASTGGDSAKSDDEPQQTVIPNLAAYVMVNPNLTQLFEHSQGPLSTHITLDLLKRSVPIAVDNAIREIIQPVVERSVSIACITSKAIVTKDFAMEGDEKKMQKAAHLMVANLAGSLALVTCREPLHSSISTHLRQILTSSLSDSAGNSSSSTQFADLEKNALDQCCAICSTDNLELGCRLIEKAATEKAVRKLNDTIASAIAVRKDAREKKGQLYYDMSIFGNENQRYPRELPDMLRPTPGGLRPEQLLVYDAFQRIPRQPQPAQTSSENSSSQSSGDANNSSTGQVNLNAISAIALKLDKTVETLLNTAGPRAQEISLAMIPPEHEIKQLIAAIPRVVASSGDPSSLNQTETDAILSFSQGILKRIYEVDLSQRLRLEALIAFLEMLNKVCPKLGKNIGTWTQYAPTKTDAERKLHRAVLLLLVRSDLVQIGDLDAHLAKSADEGRDQIWLEFLILFVRAATLENIVPPAKMPKMINIVQLIAEDRAPTSPQINPAFRKAATRLLEELRNSVTGNDSRGRQASPARARPSYEESSSMSPTSVKQLTDASLVIAKSSISLASNDPPNAKQNVTDILVNWLRVQNEAAGNDKILAQFLQLLQQKFGVGSSDDDTERFMRLTTEVVVESCVKSADANKGLRYDAIDGYSKLLSYLVIHMNGGGTPEHVAKQRLGMLNKVLGAITRSLVTSHEKAQQSNAKWDQRPWFRLLLNLVCELNTPNQLLDSMKTSIVNVFGSAFHVVQPLVVPGFAFAWLELISHRMFLSNLLLDQKGWDVMHQLLIDLFLFMEPHLRKLELTDALKKYYDGTLRVILMLVHDFPTFLAAYHLSFCNVIPENCIQLRNIILSATPKGIPFHDPISRNFKIDQLPEIAKSPVILSNVVGPLMTFKNELDNYLRGQPSPDFFNLLVSQLRKEGNSKELDAPKVNSAVLYVGMQGLARLQNDQISSNLSRSSEMELFQKLMELDDHARYIILNAFANQLRYPSSHTHYFSCVMLFLFNEAKDDGVKEQITRVLLERLITQRPHPWGLLITFIELIKNSKYQFWNHSFTRCATEIEKVFENVARSCMLPGTVVAGGGD